MKIMFLNKTGYTKQQNIEIGTTKPRYRSRKKPAMRILKISKLSWTWKKKNSPESSSVKKMSKYTELSWDFLEFQNPLSVWQPFNFFYVKCLYKNYNYPIKKKQSK